MSNEIKRVLIVDDEDDLTWSISKHLAKDKDTYELICVNSGIKALEVLSQLPIDLVVSDIRMPEITGLDLLTKIKDSYPATKVIIMTAYGSSEVQDEANKRGCLKYIEKPFEISDLRNFIMDAIQEKKGFQGTISDFQISDLIQMNCLGRMTTALKITKDDNEGVIYFDMGDIIHAECDKMEGEEAIYEILSWQGGQFSTEKGKTSPKETIIKGWQSLLLEAMRRVDESEPEDKTAADDESRRTKRQIAHILDQLAKSKGVMLVTIFDPEGFPLGSKINENFTQNITIHELTPVFSNLIKQVDSAGKDLKMNSAKDFTIEFDNALLKIIKIEDKKEYLIILSEINNNLNVLRMELKKQLKDLVDIL